MGIFYMKYRDVLPVLEVTLLKPDDTVYDLTGAVSVTMHIRLTDGATTVTRAMVIYNRPGGVVRYSWTAADWTEITVGPTIPLTPGVVEHRMEFEVLGPGAARLTFPNSGYDTLRVLTDFAQA